MENMKANIQLLDNYIEEYKIKLNERIKDNSQLELKLKISFGIENVEEKKDIKIAQIIMKYEIDIENNEKTEGNIELKIRALLSGNKLLENEEFEKMIKYNGASVIHQIVRAYIMTNSALSGMPKITLPMINFVEYFNNN